MNINKSIPCVALMMSTGYSSLMSPKEFESNLNKAITGRYTFNGKEPKEPELNESFEYYKVVEGFVGHWFKEDKDLLSLAIAAGKFGVNTEFMWMLYNMASMGAFKVEGNRSYKRSNIIEEIRDKEFNLRDYHTKTVTHHDLSHLFEIGEDIKDYSKDNEKELNRYILARGKRFLADENNEYIQSQLELEKLGFLEKYMSAKDVKNFMDSRSNGNSYNEKTEIFLDSLLNIAKKQNKAEKLNKQEEQYCAEFFGSVLLKNENYEVITEDLINGGSESIAQNLEMFFNSVPLEYRELSVSTQAYIAINDRMPMEERDVQNDMFAHVGDDGALQSCYADALPFGFVGDQIKHAKFYFGLKGVVEENELKETLNDFAKRNDTIVFIIYYNENHFLAAKFSKKENGFELIVLDPYKHDKECEKFFEELKFLLSSKIKGISVKYQATSRQADGSTCGLAAILLAKALGNGDPSILSLSEEQQKETEQDLARSMVEYVKNLRAINQEIN